jgi:hypothetical protein
MALLRTIAIALVVAGSCLVCFALIGAGWAAWSALSGAGWPAGLPAWGWLAAAVPGGVALAIAGRETMKRAESR